MELIFIPDRGVGALTGIYQRAFKHSKELYIVSAYLTNWDVKSPLGEQCKNFRLIVGKDFGITRKKACIDVMKWLPNERRAQFLVADQVTGFHPKAVFWKEVDGTCFALVGSSNLSKAAFESNCEVNSFSEISEESFKVVKNWVAILSEKSVVVSESWLQKYVEATPPKRPDHSSLFADTPLFELVLPDITDKGSLERHLNHRRKRMKVFKKNRDDLESLFRKTARLQWSEETGRRFYTALNNLWESGESGSRFQGAGWERSGRSSNFVELARSVVAVLNCDPFERDDTVSREIDRLAEKRIPTRSALFSEMLCQFFPAEFPVLNEPVRDWLKQTSFTPPRGASEGAKYIDLAIKLRSALRQSQSCAARNLAELDALIWLANQPREYYADA
ncbi:restriction endonuclease PLD domain-containing protein [Undibacterium sp. Ji50W]|uniref:restriction endonuclease PLD domain-containing protein n=1 Tax=Undibacterium sp. Ji50W TaxID=3413041 RepID=UPI003BF20D27